MRRGQIMSDRLKSCTFALATIALLIALDGVCAAETLQPAHPAPQYPNKPPRFLYIHCAAGDYEPCGLDPAMQHLNSGPRREGPREMPAPTPLMRPDFAPTR
jgi:hypothetical protein